MPRHSSTYHDRVNATLEDVVSLLHYTLGISVKIDLNLVQEGIKCFHVRLSIMLCIDQISLFHHRSLTVYVDREL